MTIKVTNVKEFKDQALQWAASFGTCCFLDSNTFDDKYHKYDCLIAAGVKHELSASIGTAFSLLKQFREKHPGWLFGFLTYDLKNETEMLSSANADRLNFPGLYFFEPAHLIILNGEEAEIISETPEEVLSAINLQLSVSQSSQSAVHIRSRFNKSAYIKAVNEIKQYINRGDIYVTNFCQEFYADNTVIEPTVIFSSLNKLSPNPFGAFFKKEQHYILSASPERFLAKRGNKIISQPIKGTAKRGTGIGEDERIKQRLKTHPKEQQENVMIVDLVRNDLTKSAVAGSVKTTELFGIYVFEHVFQMISTIECQLKKGLSEVDVIKNSFPMGSMTGAPKISAMQLMDKLERSKRGVYSGALGYFSAHGDFDFNVVIRSILYNAHEKYLSFQAGSAITFNCNAEQEYQECLVKAQAIFDVLSAAGS